MYPNSNSEQNSGNGKQMHYSSNVLSTINNAINISKIVIIEYDSPERGLSKREVEPMAIVHKERKRHLVAWCRLRSDYRSFRLDRLNCVKIINEQFTKRDDFKIEEFQDNTEGLS